VQNLVAGQNGQAQLQDNDLRNSWGISSSPTSAPWVSDNHTGLATLYSGYSGAMFSAGPNDEEHGLIGLLSPETGVSGLTLARTGWYAAREPRTTAPDRVTK